MRERTNQDWLSRVLKPVVSPDGRFHPETLERVAKLNGIRDIDRYSHLDNGRKRMVIGTRLRTAVRNTGTLRLPRSASRQGSVAAPLSFLRKIKR